MTYDGFGGPMKLARLLLSLGAFLMVSHLARSGEAANVCSETVATNRVVDGIPAYSQCTASTSGAIYSNNGVDTSTASGGTGWVRTQMSGGDQCTELAHRYFHFKWNVQSVPNGNAGTWCDGNIPTGLVKSTVPVHGDVIVFAPGSCGADATTGHVAVVDTVNSNATVTFVEQNNASRRSCAISTAACFLHATSNTGAVVDGGTPDSSGQDSGPVAGNDASPRADAAVDRARMDAPTGTGGSSGSGGAAGTGGTDSGGATGTGGASTTASSAGAGGFASSGTSGTGGAEGPGSTTMVGADGAAGTAPVTGPDAASGKGCSCRLGNRDSAHGQSGGWDGLLVLALAVALGVFRRRGFWTNRAGTAHFSESEDRRVR
jgi:surface antigen